MASIDSKAGTFTTLMQDENGLVMRTYDKSCKTLSQHRIPLFNCVYYVNDAYAFSDDLRRLAYLSDDRPSSLKLMDVQYGTSEALLDKVADSSGEMPFLAWLNDTTLLAVLSQYPDMPGKPAPIRTSSEISLIDVRTRVKTVLYKPVDPGEDAALSPDRTLLAFQDGKSLHDIDGYIKVLDLTSGKIIGQLGSGDELISLPTWSRDGSELAYVEGRNLYVWSRSKNESRVVNTFSDNSVCYSVVMGDGIIGYRCGWYNGALRILEDLTALWPGGSLKLLDLNTGRKLRSVHAQFNGRIRSIDDRTAVCGLGY